MKRILMTGATGVLGSELLYHLLYEKLVENVSMELHLIVRAAEDVTASDRIKALFDPAIMPSKLAQLTTSTLMDAVYVIEGDLKSFEFEPEGAFTFIHSAATVNLNNKPSTKDLVINNNYQATIDLVERLHEKMEHMVFVSTAYSCGEIDGQVDNDYLSMKEEDLSFRNYYEQYKFKAEQAVNDLAQKHGFSLSIVRPSIISGRLIVEPHYVMKRYIVFYLMGKFFQEMAKMGIPSSTIIRIMAKEDIFLNVIPVDYVSKAIVRLLDKPDIRQLNLVSSKPFPVRKIVEKSLGMNGFPNYHYVDEEPQDKSVMERIFYKTVAKQVLQYVDASHHTFDTTELRALLHDVPEPDIEENFDDLFEFAQSRDYHN